MAAFGFVKGTAFGPIVAIANVAHGLQTVFELPLVEHANGRGVFKPGHHFREIGKWVVGPLAGIARHEQGRFIAQGIRAHAVEVIRQLLAVVVLANAPEGLAHVGALGQIAQAADVGEKLANELIYQTTATELVIWIREFGRAHTQPQGFSYFLGRLNAMLVVFAIEQLRVDVGAATLVEPTTGLSKVSFAQMDCHFLAGAQST